MQFFQFWRCRVLQSPYVLGVDVETELFIFARRGYQRLRIDGPP